MADLHVHVYLELWLLIEGWFQGKGDKFGDTKYYTDYVRNYAVCNFPQAHAFILYMCIHLYMY